MSIGKKAYRGARVAHLVATVVIALAVAGCEMLTTIPIQDVYGETCKSAAGAYFLPKKQILFKIKQANDNGPYVLDFTGTAPVAERNRIYCLDYLGSALSDDTIHVNRDANGLLSLINSVADDKSKKIAETLIETGIIAATGNPTFGFRSVKIKVDASTFILAEYNIDPFNREQLAAANATIGPTYGYCVLVDGYTVHPDDHQAYCDNPLIVMGAAMGRAPVFKAPPLQVDLPPLPPDAGMKGILYRPNLSHELVILRRRDPGSRKKPWQVFQTVRVEMPNLAPVFSIGVERSAFVKRTTKLEFDAGVLRDVTIEKPSELLEFMEIPLLLTQAIVKVPAEIIKVRLASTNNQKLLIDAQTELLATQRAYANTLQDMQAKAAARAAAGEVNRSLRLAPGNAALGTPRALQQVDPTRAAEISNTCSLVCTPPGCSQATCEAIAASACRGQELQSCLPPLLPR
jgi:hypothetical protein